MSSAPPRVSVVVVTHNSRDALAKTLPALLRELAPDDELIVADNASSDGSAELVEELAPGATCLRRQNDGFSAACNAAAAQAVGELLVFLNPDAVPAAGFGTAIRRPLTDGREWSAWMGLVTMDGGRLVNTAGGVVHFTGIAWAGDVGVPAERVAPEPREVPWVSGACLAIPAEVFRMVGGFPEPYFLYYEDVDLSLRLRLEGGRLGIEPSARVDHEYEFAKGPHKWRMLERNRWATIVRTYPVALLALLAPALLATELALVGVALAGGWGGQKLRASADTLRAFPRLVDERRAIQATREIGPAEFARSLTASLDSPYLGRLAGLRVVRTALRAYWALVLVALGGAGR